MTGSATRDASDRAPARVPSGVSTACSADTRASLPLRPHEYVLGCGAAAACMSLTDTSGRRRADSRKCSLLSVGPRATSCRAASDTVGDAGRCPDNCRRCPDICRRCPDTVADNCRRCPDNCRRAADSCRGAATTVADTRGASSDSRRLLSDTCRAERSDCRRQLTGDRRNLFQLAPATSGKEFRTFGSGKRDQR